MKKRILCLVGTRPECVKMAPVIKALKAAPWADAIVVSTGQHRDLVHQTLDMFGLAIDVDLDVMTPNQTLAGLSARIFAKLDPLFEDRVHDLILVQGDTTSVMVASLAAFYRKVPIGHVEAGLRTHDIRTPFPEELNRVVTSIVANLHFAPTERARQNLLAERIPEERIFVTGNTVIDALLDIADRDLPCAYPRDPANRLVLVTAHRRENFGEPLESICAAIHQLHDRHRDFEFVYPVHPNPNVREPVHRILGGLDRVHLVPPADYASLVMLMKNSHFVLTDSGGIQEEAPALAKPVLVMRDETERPEAVEAGVAVLVGADKARIVEAADRLIGDSAFYAALSRGGSPYGDGKAAQRIEDACRTYLSR